MKRENEKQSIIDIVKERFFDYPDLDFRPIRGAAPWYLVSNYFGVIVNTKTNRELKTPLNNVGYRQCCVYDENRKPIVKQIAFFVLDSWTDESTPNGKGSLDQWGNVRKEVGHINEAGRRGVPSDDNLDNLCWCSRRENCISEHHCELQSKKMKALWRNPEWREATNRKRNEVQKKMVASGRTKIIGRKAAETKRRKKMEKMDQAVLDYFFS